MMEYLLLGIILLLILTLVWSLTRQPQKSPWKEVAQKLLEQNQELLNRLQAPDARTFAALQTHSTIQPSEEYIPRDDESEARLMNTEGVGVVLYPEEIKQYALDDYLGTMDEIEHR